MQSDEDLCSQIGHTDNLRGHLRQQVLEGIGIFKTGIS